MKRLALVFLLGMVAASTLGGEAERAVEGPFKAHDASRLPQEGICLHYNASKRSGDRWVAGMGDVQVAVDEGLVGHGVEAYLSLTWDVLVIDNTTRKALWAASVGGWYDRLSFVEARDAKTEQNSCLLRVGGKNGTARFFEIRSGKEKFLTADDKGLLALDEERKELRGKPLAVTKVFAGDDSSIKERRCLRISSKEEWAVFWKSHAGEDSAPPETDFEKHMVVGVFHGDSWNTSSISLQHALDCEDTVELFVRGAYFQTAGLDGGGVRVRPFGLFVIPKSPKKVVVKEDHQGLIGGPPVWRTVGEFAPQKP